MVTHYYDEKIDNTQLGYTLYLDFKYDQEYWVDHTRGVIYLSKEAGDILWSGDNLNKYNLERR